MPKTLRLLFVIAVAACAQQALTNDSIIQMVKSGTSESQIIDTIQSQPGNYTLTSDALVALRQNGVSDKVLGAMIAGGNTASKPAASPATSNLADADIPRDLHVGLYLKKNGQWEEMLPEFVNWKGGVVSEVRKRVTTSMNKDQNLDGHVTGEHSTTSAASPVEVLVYALEGVSLTEYRLLRLRGVKGDREFHIAAAGSREPANAPKDLLTFDGKQVANRTFKIVLPRLDAGEYGFLPAGSLTAAKSASFAKMYTFRVD